MAAALLLAERHDSMLRALTAPKVQSLMGMILSRQSGEEPGGWVG